MKTYNAVTGISFIPSRKTITETVPLFSNTVYESGANLMVTSKQIKNCDKTMLKI